MSARERGPVTDSFSAAEACIAMTSQRLREFPAQHAALVRLSRHINKLSQESANQTLRPHGLNFVAYNALMMLYGSEDNRLSPSQLADA
ncbi:MAG: MarR family transcriptional regulator, partial [Nevskia sp.]|nr:MarR family transcriptional regulator [Nevskia sp.]